MSQRVKWVLVVGLLALVGQVWAADCDQWNTPGFFKVATLEEVRGCLEAGAEVNTSAWGEDTPLHYATHLQSPELVTLLLDAGAEVNVRDGDSNTPLHYATHLQSPELITLLLDAGAEVNALGGEVTTSASSPCTLQLVRATSRLSASCSRPERT